VSGGPTHKSPGICTLAHPPSLPLAGGPSITRFAQALGAATSQDAAVCKAAKRQSVTLHLFSLALSQGACAQSDGPTLAALGFQGGSLNPPAAKGGDTPGRGLSRGWA
jgi:hypothetical protein